MTDRHVNREPSVAEKMLLMLLVGKADGLLLPDDWMDRVRVREIDDGGMGSFLIASLNGIESERLFGRLAADHQFTDDDGVTVVASLNIDQRGELFEMDLWKSDFSPLIRLGAAIEEPT